MVDAAISLNATPTLRHDLAEGRANTKVSVKVAGEAGLAGYSRLAVDGIHSPSQSPLWIDNWVRNIKPDFLVATLSHDGAPAFSVALEVTRRGPLRLARFMGDRHANGNMPATTAAFAESASAAEMEEVLTAIRRSRPDIDVVAFERLADEIGGVRNPLLQLPHQQSANLSLAVSLSGGFDALLGRASGKRKRKKHRSQMRKFESAGGFRRVEASNAAETNALLDAFFEMKQIRFRKAGLANVFGEPQVQAFFRSIFADALGVPRPSFVLHGLEVDGKVRAVTGSSRCADRLICEFGAIAEDDMSFASPGEFLFFDNIEEACQEGLSVYDFSVGDEPYKRLWCDLEIPQFDAVVPLSAKGHLYAATMRAGTRLKGFVKNNKAIWKLIKAFRKKAAAQSEPTAEE
jgi:CelD/BcsL family acetyltransferase involved in cellulose biosynthesis